jgi:hypothetical protein
MDSGPQCVRDVALPDAVPDAGPPDDYGALCAAAVPVTPRDGAQVTAVATLGAATRAGSCGGPAPQPSAAFTFTLPAARDVTVWTMTTATCETWTIALARGCMPGVEAACFAFPSPRHAVRLEAGTWFVLLRGASVLRDVELTLAVMPP